MKKTLKMTAALVLIIAFVMSVCACAKIPAEGLWENATYRKDTTLGEGSKTVTVDVEVGEYSVAITIKTDAKTLGEALYAEGVINDPSFFDTCNGIVADWNKDKAYWGFYKGEELMSVGVDGVEIMGGERYRIAYTK